MTALEMWLEGPVAGVQPALQPVAHSLLQVRQEAREIVSDFPVDRLWNRPAGMASVGFHLQHIAGVVDRLFTYARGESLSQAQHEKLASEGIPAGDETVESLLRDLDNEVERALTQLRATPVEALNQVRGVGRKQLPSTTLGLVFHAAEHSQRHLGQLLVTAKILKAQSIDWSKVKGK